MSTKKKGYHVIWSPNGKNEQRALNVHACTVFPKNAIASSRLLHLMVI